MNNQYVPLRPGPQADGELDGGSGPVMGMRDRSLVKRRRIGVSVACEACRRKKVRCDGRRPRCANCTTKEEPCNYRDDAPSLGKEARETMVEAIRLLNLRPPREALDLLTALKDEPDANVIMAALRNGADDTESNADIFNSIAPAQDPLNASELEIHHSNAYPVLSRIEPSVLKQHLYQTLNRSATSTQPPDWDATTFEEYLVDGVKEGDDDDEGEGGAQFKPFCDARLQSLQISQWTTVSIESPVAAHAISLYLETDHPLLGFFDPSSFVSDLVSGNTEYCSAILVNALLYWACMYGAVDENVDLMAKRFCDEAERLWEEKSETDSVLTLISAQFLSMGYMGQGRDHSVVSYLTEASGMAARLGLFGDTDLFETVSILNRSPEDISALLHAAWGSFNWITLMSLFYRQPGLYCPKQAPQLPIPDISGVAVERQHPDTLFLPRHADYMGGVFPVLCRFWRIMQDVSLSYGSDKRGYRDSSAACRFAEFKYRELLAWSSALPANLLRNDTSPHYVQILHTWFHAAILDIFRPHVGESSTQFDLKTFTAGFTPQAAYDASVRQLKQLVANYRLNFDSSRYTMLWHTGLIYLANALLQSQREDDWLYYFMLCIYGYERLYRSWRVMGAISVALLSMAVRSGDLSTVEARKIFKDLHHEDSQDSMGVIRATFMADLALERWDPSLATVEKQAHDFEEAVSLREFTNVLDNESMS